MQRPPDFPEDLANDILLLREEQEWRKAVTTPGAHVRLSDTGWDLDECKMVPCIGWVPRGGLGGTLKVARGGLREWVGQVVVPAEDPDNGRRQAGMCLVEHDYEDEHGVCKDAKRWYRALDLEPVEDFVPIRAGRFR